MPAKRAGLLKFRRNLATGVIRDIVQPTDVVVTPIGIPGQIISEPHTLYFLHALQLEIYRATIQNGGDGYIPRSPPFRRVFENDLELVITATGHWVLSFGHALFAIQSILHRMLYPASGSYGFLERIWEVFEIHQLGPRTKLGSIRLFRSSVALEYAST